MFCNQRKVPTYLKKAQLLMDYEILIRQNTLEWKTMRLKTYYNNILWGILVNIQRK